MKILWIADFGLHHNIGGAQRTDSFIIQQGLKRGYEITQFNYDTPEILGEYDIVVSGNLESLHRRRDVFDYIISHPYHVRYEHDSNAYLPEQMRKDLFGSAKWSFFLSEYHHQQFLELYDLSYQNVKIITSPIDCNKFMPLDLPRENKTLYIGFMHVLKGTHNFFNEVLNNPDKQYVMACWGDKFLEVTARRFKNVEWLGKVDYEEMPALYNSYSTLYYHPDKFEPFCRAVGEAALCGMELDCSDNIGAVRDINKYGIEKLRHMCASSPRLFWNTIENDHGNSDVLSASTTSTTTN